MDIRELKTFLKLAETLNYQRASEELSYAPSTLNRHIRMMEHDFGVQLFERNGRGIFLTNGGKMLIPHARKILEEYSAAEDEICARREEPAVRLAGCETILSYGMRDLISAFSGEYSDARLAMTTSQNSQIPSIIREGTADIGFYYTLDDRKDCGLQDYPLFREPMCLMARADGNLAARKGLHYRDLAGMDFVFPHEDCFAAVCMMDALKERNIAPGKISCLGMMSLVVDCARNTGAVMAMPYSTSLRLEKTENLRTLDLDEEPLYASAGLICRREEFPGMTRELIGYAQKYAETLIVEDPGHYCPVE